MLSLIKAPWRLVQGKEPICKTDFFGGGIFKGGIFGGGAYLRI